MLPHPSCTIRATTLAILCPCKLKQGVIIPFQCEGVWLACQPHVILFQSILYISFICVLCSFHAISWFFFLVEAANRLSSVILEPLEGGENMVGLVSGSRFSDSGVDVVSLLKMCKNWKKPSALVKGKCVLISRFRFEVDIGYSAEVIGVFKQMNSRNYGESVIILLLFGPLLECCEFSSEMKRHGWMAMFLWTENSVCFKSCDSVCCNYCRCKDQKVEFLAGGLSQTGWVAAFFSFFFPLARAIFGSGEWIVTSFCGLSLSSLGRWVANGLWNGYLPLLSDFLFFSPDSKLYMYIIHVIPLGEWPCSIRFCAEFLYSFLEDVSVFAITKIFLLPTYSSSTWTLRSCRRTDSSLLLPYLNR